MSRGLGRIQQAIRALIESNQDGAWSMPQLCKLVYPDCTIEKQHRVAIGRALNKMTLPDGWAWKRTGGLDLRARVLFNEYSDESQIRFKFISNGSEASESLRSRYDW